MSSLQLPVVHPFPWAELLNYLAPRCISGAERVEGGCYIRDELAHVRIADDALQVELLGGDATDAEARVRHLFRPDLETRHIDAILAKDSQLNPAVRTAPGMRLPGTWSGFELAIRVVIGQQVTVAAARTLLSRVVDRCGGCLSPASLLDADTGQLGMPQARVDSLLRVARLASEVDFDRTPWAALRPQLAALKGIGPWTLGYLDMRLGLEDDCFPTADVGLQQACGMRDARKLAAHAERWAPWRSFAAMRLWQA